SWSGPEETPHRAGNRPRVIESSGCCAAAGFEPPKAVPTQRPSPTDHEVAARCRDVSEPLLPSVVVGTPRGGDEGHHMKTLTTILSAALIAGVSTVAMA